MEDHSKNMTENFGWLEIIFFYSIAIVVCFWQWWKMRREVREMRAQRQTREEREAQEASRKETDSGQSSDV